MDSAQGRDLASIFGDVSKSEILSENKPTLEYGQNNENGQKKQKLSNQMFFFYICRNFFAYFRNSSELV